MEGTAGLGPSLQALAAWPASPCKAALSALGSSPATPEHG